MNLFELIGCTAFVGDQDFELFILSLFENDIFNENACVYVCYAYLLRISFVLSSPQIVTPYITGSVNLFCSFVYFLNCFSFLNRIEKICLYFSLKCCSFSIITSRKTGIFESKEKIIKS